MFHLSRSVLLSLFIAMLSLLEVTAFANQIRCEHPDIQNILTDWKEKKSINPFTSSQPWAPQLRYWRQKTSLSLLRSSLEIEGRLLKYTPAEVNQGIIPFPSQTSCSALAHSFPQEWRKLVKEKKALKADFERWQTIGNLMPQVKWRSLLMTVLEVQYIRHMLKSGSWRRLETGRIPKSVKYPDLYPLIWGSNLRGTYQKRLSFLLEKHPILNRHSRDILGYGTELLVDRLFKVAFLKTAKAKNRDIKNYVETTSQQLISEIKLQSCQLNAFPFTLDYKLNAHKTIHLDSTQSCHIQAYQVWANQLPMLISKQVIELMSQPRWTWIRQEMESEIQKTQEKWKRGIAQVRQKLCRADPIVLQSLPEALGLAISEEQEPRKSKEAIALVCQGAWWKSPHQNLESTLSLGAAGVFVGGLTMKRFFPKSPLSVTAPLLSGTMMLGSHVLKWRRQHSETESSIFLRKAQFNAANPFGANRNLKVLHNGATYLEMAVTTSIAGLQFWNSLQTAKGIATATQVSGSADVAHKAITTPTRAMGKHFKFTVPGLTAREALIFLSGFPAGRYFEIMEYKEMNLNPFEDPVFYVNSAKDLISDLLMAKFFGNEGNLLHAAVKSSFSSLLVNDIAENLNYKLDGSSIPEKSLVFDLVWGTTSAPVVEYIFFQGERFIENMLRSSAPPLLKKHALWVLPVITTLLQHATKEAKASAAKLRYVKGDHELVDAITGLRYMVADLPFLGNENELGKDAGFSQKQKQAILDLLREIEKSKPDRLFLDKLFKEVLDGTKDI